MINIKEIWNNHKPTGDIIIKTRIDDIPHLNCYAATDHITSQHIFIMSISSNVAIPELKNHRFKGVEIYALPNNKDNATELYIHLLDNGLKDVFSLFIQNLLEEVEVSITENEALTTTLNVISSWKKLFDKINFNGLSSEAQKGLIGELLFFNFLLDNNKASSVILNSWTGADFEDKDFTLGSVGIEIKLTSSKYPKIKITNERQLDADNLSGLFLILYVVEDVKESGVSLNSLIELTRERISTNDERNFFNERLLLLGYREEDKEHYEKQYSLKRTFAFKVNTDFPKIVKSQLSMGIYNTSYNIELSAVDDFAISMEDLIEKI